jgi:hypothetical protein
MKRILILVIILMITVTIGAQNSQISESPKVKSFMEYFVKIGKEEPYIDGWRIKVISTTDRRALESAKWVFENKYPDKVYSLNHEPPYYSLKVGAFETRLDVEPMLVQFKEDFPLAIPFRDRIMKTEFFEQNGN